MDIRTYLKDHKVLCDGAFGTYCMSLRDDIGVPERANLIAPELVHQIHRQYLEAGASLIRTNTFAVQEGILHEKQEALQEYLTAGYKIAAQEAEAERERSKREVYVAGDIGPLPTSGDFQDQGTAFYEWTAETLLSAGAEILLFESFPDMEAIRPVIQKIYAKYHPFIMVQFCLNQYGYSSTGASADQLFRQAEKMEEISVVGLNCGIGPVHMLRILEKTGLPQNKWISVLPNAGYPKLSRNRMIYHQNVAYFADKLKEIASLGADLIGGCCGTTPSYIDEIARTIPLCQMPRKAAKIRETEERKQEIKSNAFYAKKEQTKKKLIAAELVPPVDIQIEKLMDAANALKSQNVDVITLPDSPSGRTRVDSIATAIRVYQETGICVMPHICCRDKNNIAMIAQIMGAYINEIRNFLVITGDPVPAASRSDIKSVFSYNSVGVMQILKEMNQNNFAADPICYGAALNCGAVNMPVEIGRMKRKIQAGADFFITQPIFNAAEIEHLKEAKAETGARIICGLMPLVSYRNAQFIQNEITGINITDETVNRFHPEMTKQEAEKVGVEICREIVRGTWDIADGYYFSIPFYRAYLLGRIMEGMPHDAEEEKG